MTNFPFGFNMPGGGGPNPDDPQWAAFMAQLQQILSTSSTGPVNWDLARQVATGLAREGDLSLTAGERSEVSEALRLADLWLDPITSLPSGVKSAAGWSRLDWIEATLPTWQRLCDPVASRVVDAMSTLLPTDDEDLPEEAKAQLGPLAALAGGGLSGMLGGIGGMMFGAQVGQGVGTLSSEVLSSSDIGLPLAAAGTAALLPANLTAFTEGLELPADEVRLFVALREAAHHRLFGHVGWLRGHVLDAVDAYARGITVDRAAFEEAMGRFDPSDPESMQEALSGGMFEQADTPEQKQALARLETALALIEGWVAHVTDTAAAGRLPGAGALAETFRRRRAAGGPAEQTFATLVGLHMRPRRLREAAELWAALAEHRGAEGRDALWGHPDLIPSADDLDDPQGFARADADVEIPGLEDL
jgi:putative hydrolase